MIPWNEEDAGSHRSRSPPSSSGKPTLSRPVSFGMSMLFSLWRSWRRRGSDTPTWEPQTTHVAVYASTTATFPVVPGVRSGGDPGYLVPCSDLIRTEGRLCGLSTPWSMGSVERTVVAGPRLIRNGVGVLVRTIPGLQIPLLR